MSEIFQDPWQRVCGKNQIFSWFRYLVHIFGDFAGQAWVKICMMALWGMLAPLRRSHEGQESHDRRWHAPVRLDHAFLGS